MNAVLRAITNISGIRDRSVVKSSVIPSAKYCWSGSLLRLAKGNTTIDRRGATMGCDIDVAEAISGAEDGFVIGQNHHTPTPSTSAAATNAEMGMPKARWRCGIAVGMLDASRSAIASGRSA